MKNLSKQEVEDVKAFHRATMDFLGNLWERWQDEKDHEDIKDYGVALQKSFREGYVLVKMQKRPFGFTFTAHGATFLMTCTSRTASVEQVG